MLSAGTSGFQREYTDSVIRIQWGRQPSSFCYYSLSVLCNTFCCCCLFVFGWLCYSVLLVRKYSYVFDNQWLVESQLNFTWWNDTNAFTHRSRVKIPVVNSIVPTHIVLLSGGIATFSPSVSKSCYLITNNTFRWHANTTSTATTTLSYCSVACAVLSARIVTWQALPARLQSPVQFHTPLNG